MGRDKATVQVAGVPLFERAARVLDELTDEVWLASGAEHRFPQSGRGELADARPRGASESVPESDQVARSKKPGPLAALVAGLERARELGRRGVLFVACDLVLLERSLLDPLIAAWSDGADVALWRRDGHAEPLCALYSVGCVGAARTAFDGGGRRPLDIWRVAPQLQVTELEAGPREGALLLNVNTPEDFAQAGLAQTGLDGSHESLAQEGAA